MTGRLPAAGTTVLAAQTMVLAGHVLPAAWPAG